MWIAVLSGTFQHRFQHVNLIMKGLVHPRYLQRQLRHTGPSSGTAEGFSVPYMVHLSCLQVGNQSVARTLKCPTGWTRYFLNRNITHEELLYLPNAGMFGETRVSLSPFLSENRCVSLIIFCSQHRLYVAKRDSRSAAVVDYGSIN